MKNNSFYVFHDGKDFIRVTQQLKLRRTKDISNASYWNSLSDIKSWVNKVYSKYPYMKITPANLTIKIW